MISLSEDFDLGRDETRIKDKRDGERQRATATEVLSRFFHDDPNRRWDLQLVADEVGMGKTFVALAVAYSILQAMREHRAHEDLRACARRVLVIAPQNSLATKWKREVGEFVKRCVFESGEKAHTWFDVQFVERLDDLAMCLRADDGPSVVVTQMGVLSGGKKLKNYDLKRRFLLGVLFRFWGVRFNRDARERLLRGAPGGWPASSDDLTRLEDEEWQRLPFENADVVRSALEELAVTPEGLARLDGLLESCRSVAEPYTRNRADRFVEVEKGLNAIYRDICFSGVTKALPLVIVDEAHNWKNGPREGTNGYRGFERLIAPLTRRALLLTATPFQLRPEEMLELLRVGSVIAPTSERTRSLERRARAETHRSAVLAPVLEAAAAQSRTFATAWGRLSPKATPLLQEVWSAPHLARVRSELRAEAHLEGRVDRAKVERMVDGAVVGQPLVLRDILREGLRLYAYNEDLSQELGAFVIRHRRRTDHRVFRVGAEFTNGGTDVLRRSDRSTLHAAPGMDVRGDAELPHYLLMRCVSEMKQGRGRSSLGTALTGCYSTLLQSADGRSIQKKLGDGVGRVYLDLLLKMVGEDKDAAHPKVQAAVAAVITAWRAGEKTLLFCFRTHTARRLQQILDACLESELGKRRVDVLGGGTEALTRLRGRFTRRDGDLVPLGLDRVLWSLRWAAWSDASPLPDLADADLQLADSDLSEIARLSIRYGVALGEERVDRVFLHRAIEHVLARRLARRRDTGHLFQLIISDLADEKWVRAPYGIEVAEVADDGDSISNKETGGLDERGVHVVYRAQVAEPDPSAVRVLADELSERRERARKQRRAASVFDAYAEAPSFWLGREPEQSVQQNPGAHAQRALASLHLHLLTLTRTGGELDWRQRMLVFQSLRRALMRESVLLRILPERSELDEGRWGELLVDRFFTPLPGQRESMADRLAVFVEDLQAAGGAVYLEGTSRHAMYEATRMRDTGFVVLVDGSTPPDRRERVFAGFNSPLLPEVLICTSVGQEGIDLHRHCRNVIHYDLAWNPAVLEQRTGRVDRIGSKTFRERSAVEDPGATNAFLDVGVPFLAGTYDERMYEEIRIRAQTFEVLTGGDVAADNLEGSDDGESAEGSEAGLSFPILPPEMTADLRVRLHVWEPEESAKPVGPT